MLLINLLLIIIAAAVYVTCQELTSTLRGRSHACRGEEVIFTCTIRGSQTLTSLILAWSSDEYIGQGVNPLRFTTDSVPGTNRTSTINGNVTATLTRNTNISGVPTLESELHIVADQASTVTCTSEITSSRMSQEFNVSGTGMYMYILYYTYRILILVIKILSDSLGFATIMCAEIYHAQYL